jgi:hypothetical protein
MEVKSKRVKGEELQNTAEQPQNICHQAREPHKSKFIIMFSPPIYYQNYEFTKQKQSLKEQTKNIKQPNPSKNRFCIQR